MKNKEEQIMLSQARSYMYRFLSGLYLMEVDEEQLAALKKMLFPVIEGDTDADMDIREGYTLLQPYVQSLKAEELDDLAADYAKVFLAAGDAAGRAAFPYESVYVDKKRQVGGSTAMQMKSLYLARGYTPDPEAYRTMDDNIGLILEYMSVLCDEITQDLESGNLEHAEAVTAEQKKFLKKHVTNWIYSFTSDMIKFSETPFYKAIAMITNGFIKKEAALLKGGKIWDIA